METTVIKAYTDRFDGSVHLVGEVVDLEEGRLAELAVKGFVEEAEKPAADEPQEVPAGEEPAVEEAEKPAADEPQEVPAGEEAEKPAADEPQEVPAGEEPAVEEAEKPAAKKPRTRRTKKDS